ncbi:MAG: molecular chaperone TorD family protein [Longimicrobiales bacterium]
MELFRALGLLIEPPAPEHSSIAEVLGLPSVPDAAAYATDISFQRYPFASVYLGPEGMMGGEARARIVGFWSALGLDVPEEPDHLSALLSLLATLDEQSAEETDPAHKALLEEARSTLLWEHLMAWAVPYLTSFSTCREPFYQQWGTLVENALREASGAAGLPGYVPGALLELAPLEDPRSGGGGDAFLKALLAPGRSGFVILRDDLAEAADALGLALRAGERRYALTAFFAQDPGRTLDWMAFFSERWLDRLGGREGGGVILDWWKRRAAYTTALLRDLATDSGPWEEAVVS